MSMTIYYLSATGNSLQMAKMLAEQLGTTDEVRLVSIPDALEKNDLTPSGSVGFVLPLHFFALPLLAEEFLTQVDLSQTTYTFGLVTAGFHYISDAFHELTELVYLTGGELHAAFYVDMVSVYLPLNDLPPQAKTERKLQSAEKRLKEIATQIAERKAVKSREYFAWPSRLIHRLVQKHPEKLDEEFFTTEACTICGLCAQICPRKNIQLTNGQPTWHRQCTQCLACLHICPTKSIELGQRTKGKRRYHHPAIQVKELFPAKNK